MSVGIYDADYLNSPRNSIYNIQAMKLSSYYKSKFEIVTFITTLSKCYLYTKVFYFQNNPDLPFAEDITKYDNIEFMGRAFSGEKYKPLPSEMEKMEPDIYLYDKKAISVIQTDKDEAMYRLNTRAFHIQLSLDGKTLNPYLPPMRTNAVTYVIHDPYFLDVEGWYEYIKPIENRSLRYICLACPLKIYDEKDFELLSRFKYSASSKNMDITYKLSYQKFQRFINNNDRTFVQHCALHYGSKNLKGAALASDLIEITRYIVYAKVKNKRCRWVYDGMYEINTPRIYMDYLLNWYNGEGQESFLEFYRKRGRVQRLIKTLFASIPELETYLKVSPKKIIESGGSYLL